MADPQALGVVVDAARAFDYVGLPEGRYHLAHACLYLATAPKSNSSMAFFDALKVVSEEASDDIPNPLRDASRDKEGFGHGEGYMYPHAYKDHWVAQQYLPGKLQGKMFYQPSDQGFEKNIQTRVARIREAQLEAMVEEEPLDPFDVLAEKQEGDRQAHQKAWIQRTGSNRGSHLGDIRDTMLKMANIQHDDLVLDLHARTGLLCNEVSRITVEGGVWGIAYDAREYETLSRHYENHESLSRPQIVQSSADSFVRDIRAVSGTDVVFNAIAGRNVLTRVIDKKAYIQQALELLHPTGSLVFAEIVPQLGQRLSELPGFKGLDASLQPGFIETEKAFFNDPNDPMLNWTPESLKEEAATIAGIIVKTVIVPQTATIRISPATIDFWFRSSGKEERTSLGSRLKKAFPTKDIAVLKSFFHALLDNKDVPWKSFIAYIKINH
jgi:putative ATPase